MQKVWQNAPGCLLALQQDHQNITAVMYKLEKRTLHAGKVSFVIWVVFFLYIVYIKKVLGNSTMRAQNSSGFALWVQQLSHCGSNVWTFVWTFKHEFRLKNPLTDFMKSSEWVLQVDVELRSAFVYWKWLKMQPVLQPDPGRFRLQYQYFSSSYFG